MASQATDELEVIRRHRTTQIVRRAAWLHFKLSLAVWAFTFMVVPPTTVQNAVGNTIWLGVCLMGALTSATGLCLGFKSEWRTVSIWVELAGLACMIVGPFVYWTTQLSLIVGGQDDAFQQRFALSFFAYAMVAAVLARLATVIPRFHSEKGRVFNRGQ